MKNILFTAITIILHVSVIKAQDFHFSQYENNLSMLNPAATANIDGSLKINSCFKNQWGQISAKAYTTSGFSADFALLKPTAKNKKLNVGLWVLNDVSGKSKYGTVVGGINIAASQTINSKNTLCAGIMIGMGQRSANLSNLAWDNQYADGAYSAALSSKESVYAASNKYLDVGVGIIWKYLQRNDLPVTFGLSLTHPNASNKALGTGTDKMVAKGVAFISLDLLVKKIAGKGMFALAPKLLITQQAGHRETIPGLFAKYIIKAGAQNVKIGLSDAFFDFGIYSRMQDALILASSFGAKGFKLGVSYDINTSTLTQVSKYKGGLELSLSYNFINDKRVKL
ncbi:MAG: PorP/SprF family type IX secretion system membrane protein [Bacteroidia bacterium]|nr:PorP/SprF family type IX secretion system membrane protein [Bacteroidia bacterium]